MKIPPKDQNTCVPYLGENMFRIVRLASIAKSREGLLSIFNDFNRLCFLRTWQRTAGASIHLPAPEGAEGCELVSGQWSVRDNPE